MADHQYSIDLDGELFRRQRKLLFELAHSAEQRESVSFGAEHQELLEGLVELTDSLAEQAHDRYGIDCLLEAEAG